MIGWKLRLRTKSGLTALAWAIAFRACMVVYLGWIADLLIGPGAGPFVQYILAICDVCLVDIPTWLWAWLRRLGARLSRRKATVPDTGSAQSQTPFVPSDLLQDRRA